jgi:Helix-hairpin-helix domain
MPSKRLSSPDITPPLGADDLRQISGIGPAVAARLYNAGILTYAQLAAQSPEAIAALVVDLSGLSAARIARQDWIGQAQELLSELTPASRAEGAIPNERQHYATFKVDLLLNEGGDVRRTHVVHIQDGRQATWAGWEDTRLIAFFAEHAELQTHAIAVPGSNADTTDLPLAAEAQAPSVAAVEDQPVGLQLDVRALSVAPVSAASVDGPANVSHLRAQLKFELSGATTDPITTSESPYTVLILACALPSGQTVVLAADQQRLSPNLLAYATTVDFPLLDPGRYQIQGVVLLPQASKVGATLGPVVRILPA